MIIGRNFATRIRGIDAGFAHHSFSEGEMLANH